jgi:hypothetical protein
MSELAYNGNGEKFTPPATAIEWKLSKVEKVGPPRVLYDKLSGLPQFCSIDIDAESFRNVIGGVPGKYRLDAVDGDRKRIECPPAYVVIEERAAPETSTSAPMAPVRDAREDAMVLLLKAHTDSIKAQIEAQTEAMRSQTEMMRTLATANVEMMKAGAELVRAADGAGLPRRDPPPAPDVYYVEESDDEERRTPPPSIDWNEILKVAGAILPSVCDPEKLGALWSLLRGRGGGADKRRTSGSAADVPRERSQRQAPAAPAPRPRSSARNPQQTATRAPAVTRPDSAPSTSPPVGAPVTAATASDATPATATAIATVEPTSSTNSLAVVRDSDTQHDGAELESSAGNHDDDAEIDQAALDELPPQLKMMMYFGIFKEQLTPGEWKLCETAIREMSDEERTVWREHLLGLPIEDALAEVRAAIAGGAA